MKRKYGCGTRLFALGVVFAAIIGFRYLAVAIDRWRFPWGYADSGQPALIGTWMGAFTTGSGKRLAMLVDIEFVELGRNHRYTHIIRTRHDDSWLEGRVRVCDGPGRARHLVATGEPEDNRATRFYLATSPMDTVQTDGLAPSHLYGRWDGSDSLAVEASLYLRRGESAITQSDDPDTGLKKTPFTLRRGTEAEFTSLCGRL